MAKNKSVKKITKNSFQKIILDNVPVSVITIDKRGYITSANEYFKKVSESPDFQRVNIFTSKFFIREKLVSEYKKLLTKGGIFRRENVHEITSKGEDRYLSVIAVSFKNEKDEIDGVISMASDNTEAVVFENKLLQLNESIESEIREKTKSLDKANKELVKTLESKSVFMTDVSHEFRTSLAIMQSSLELLYRSKVTEKADSELFNNIYIEIIRVSTALNNVSLLNNAKTNSQKFFKKFDLDQVISLISKELQTIADEKNIKINYRENQPHFEMTGNKEDIEKMLLNLVRNAITYNKSNGWINVWTEESKDGLNLKVQDSGIGIPKDQFSNIFERFSRIDKSRSRNKYDSGLGLSICKYVAESHGGNISVESKIGVGSTFTVYLPLDSRK